MAGDQWLDWHVDLLGGRMRAQQLALWSYAERCRPVAGDDRFSRAQAEYLKGNWFEAESLLHAILADTPRDAEAQLLLVSVLRHSRRWAAALRRLEQLELLDTSARWRFEIHRERQLILKRQQEHTETSAENQAVAA